MNLKRYFEKSPLIPAIIQEKGTDKVLMLAYMNEESLEKTIETGYTWFFSRSRNELWNKGATSGNVQKVVSITADCDDDTLLIVVDQRGPACHTGNHSCFYKTEELMVSTQREEVRLCPLDEKDFSTEESLRILYNVVLDRKRNLAEGSYTCYLFEKGLDKILKKCGEESSEVIIAAKNGSFALTEEERNKAQLDTKNEICDLLYHLIVLMVNEGIELDEIYEILQERSQKIGNLKKFHQSDHNS